MALALKQFLDERNISQVCLAKAIKEKKTTVNNILKGWSRVVPGRFVINLIGCMNKRKLDDLDRKQRKFFLPKKERQYFLVLSLKTYFTSEELEVLLFASRLKIYKPYDPIMINITYFDFLQKRQKKWHQHYVLDTELFTKLFPHFLKEVVEKSKLTHAEFARRTKIPRKLLYEALNWDPSSQRALPLLPAHLKTIDKFCKNRQYSKTLRQQILFSGIFSRLKPHVMRIIETAYHIYPNRSYHEFYELLSPFEKKHKQANDLLSN